MKCSKICHRRCSRVLRAQARADEFVCRLDHGALRVAHRTMVQLSFARSFVSFALQTVGLAWKSIMRDRAENSYYCSTVCVHCWWCAVHQELPAPPPHTTYHWQPQGGFTTAIAGEPTTVHRNKTQNPIRRLLAFLSAVGSCNLTAETQHLLSYLEGSVCRVCSR